MVPPGHRGQEVIFHPRPPALQHTLGALQVHLGKDLNLQELVLGGVEAWQEGQEEEQGTLRGSTPAGGRGWGLGSESKQLSMQMTVGEARPEERDQAPEDSDLSVF